VALNETAKEVAAQARVDAAFKKIPREVLEKKAVEQGDVHFFELGALSVETKIKKREVTLKLSCACEKFSGASRLNLSGLSIGLGLTIV
jgi:hypothetical protein